ncbi:hypothetical protein BH24ACT7_BH24ACT7_25720 [soil metagenome]
MAPPGDLVWLWVATATRSHYTQGWFDAATGGVRPASTGGRLATLCQLGPMDTTQAYFAGRTGPTECKVCWRRWVRLLRTLDSTERRP